MDWCQGVVVDSRTPRLVGECLAVKERKRRLGVELGVVGFGVWGYTCTTHSAAFHSICKVYIFQKQKACFGSHVFFGGLKKNNGHVNLF